MLASVDEVLQSVHWDGWGRRGGGGEVGEPGVAQTPGRGQPQTGILQHTKEVKNFQKIKCSKYHQFEIS